MGFEAKLREEYKARSVTAFGGREFVKGEWRGVPVGQEGSAGAHPFLELREAAGGAVSQEPSPVVGPVAGVVDGPAASGRKRGAPPAPAVVDEDAPPVDEVDKDAPRELDETQGTPPEESARAPEKGKGESGARRGKA